MLAPHKKPRYETKRGFTHKHRRRNVTIQEGWVNRKHVCHVPLFRCILQAGATFSSVVRKTTTLRKQSLKKIMAEGFAHSKASWLLITYKLIQVNESYPSRISLLLMMAVMVSWRCLSIVCLQSSLSFLRSAAMSWRWYLSPISQPRRPTTSTIAVESISLIREYTLMIIGFCVHRAIL